jgi:PIN domain nuclease of toxin-antitoxin system
VLNDPQLSRSALDLIKDRTNEILISPASYWEIAIKVRLRKLELFAAYDDFMQRGITGNNFGILPIEPGHTGLLTTMPFHHKDPFDRFLAAQALIESVPLISNDAALDPYGVQRVW